MATGFHDVRFQFFELEGNAKVEFKAPDDVVTWKEKEPMLQKEQRGLTLFDLYGFYAIAAAVLIAIGVIYVIKKLFE